jgi:hypothetical protein
MARRLPRAPEGISETDAERRAFLREIIWSNPEAFGSDLDLQAMLRDFPRAF